MQRSAFLTSLLCSLALVMACQEDTDTPAPSPDAGTATDIAADDDTAQQATDTGVGPEADAAPDTTLVDSLDAADANCTLTGFDPGQQIAFIGAQTFTDLAQGHWNLTVSSTDGTARLVVESRLGEAGGPAAPGTYPLFFEENDSKLQVSLHAGCGDEGCETFYAAISGSAEIKSLDLSSGGDVSVTLSNALFATGEPQNDGTVEGLSTWCVDGSYGASFQVQGGAGEALPDFDLADQAGAAVSLSTLQGTMAVVLINFNEWCPPCMSAATASEGLWKEYEAADDRFDVSYTQLLYDDPTGDPSDQDDAMDWATEHGITYPVLHGQGVQDFLDVALGDEFDIMMTTSTGGIGFPAYWIVDPLGQIREFSMGFSDGAPNFSTAQLVAHFDAFLAEHPDWTK